jgi:hypothetical protein
VGRCPADHPLTGARTVGGLLACLVLVGCSPTVSITDVGADAAQLDAALATGQAAFSAHFSPALTGDQWYPVLRAGSARIAAVNDSPAQVQVTTRFDGDRRTATEVLTLELADDGAIRGTVDAGERPIWALEATTVTPATHGTVLSSGLSVQARRTWVARLDQASVAVAQAGVLTAGNDWDGGLVVELPADALGFTEITGGSATDTAAITTCSSGTPRIVVNPVAQAQGTDYLSATLVHEAVHVATESPCKTGVAWVVEGMAESVAAANDPATAAANAKLVRAYLRQHGIPDQLPVTLETQTDYALAQLAADQVRVHLGTRAAAFFAAGVSGELSRSQAAAAKRWYRAALRDR